MRPVSWFLCIFAIAALAAPFPAHCHASGRAELGFGVQIPRYKWDERSPAQPGLGVEVSSQPRGWPIGFTAYAAGAADWYEGQTLNYPGFGDWLTTDNRLLYGAIGAGLEKAWLVGRARLSAAGGLMASTTSIRESRDDWSETYDYRANGEWISVAASRPIGRGLDVGVRARYSWEEYARPDLRWLDTGGALIMFTLGLRPSGQ